MTPMQHPENATYADVVRMSMKTKDNATGAPVTIRELSRGTGYSYEHCRKVFKGEPVVSPEFNEAICKFLGLEPRDMWLRVQKEKVHRRFADVPVQLQPPADDFFVTAWAKLTAEDIDSLKKIVEGMVYSNERRRKGIARMTTTPQPTEAVIM